MRTAHLSLLACPRCNAELTTDRVGHPDRENLETATLVCVFCAQRYPIVRGVPRFVSSDNYAQNFGLQWAAHPQLQYDSATGIDQSGARFFGQTGWPQRMEGETVLEIGSGAGRFTEQALSTGATVVAVDYSDAVDINYGNHRMNPNVLVVQADLYKLPVRRSQFNRMFCFGVLQHTPDPKRAFTALTTLVRPGGHIVVDVYLKYRGLKAFIDTKYWVRPMTRRMAPATLYKLVRAYILWMWPCARLLTRIPWIGVRFNWKLLIADHGHDLSLPDEALRECAVLDTFDMLSSTYDYPQRPETVALWIKENGLIDSEVTTSGALIVARASQPERKSPDAG